MSRSRSPAGRGRASAALAARGALPVGLAVLPFGVVYGVAVDESAVDTVVGASASWIILAGAAQLSLLDLIGTDAFWIVAVGTALVINARFALYSAALAPSFADYPTGWRFGLAYLMTDQAASLSLLHNLDEHDPLARRWFYLGGALLVAAFWWIGTIVGVAAAGSIPDSLDPAFAVPAMFIALLVPNLVSRPTVVAAVVAIVVTVLAGALPDGMNILVGALAGIAVGDLSAR